MLFLKELTESPLCRDLTISLTESPLCRGLTISLKTSGCLAVV